MVAKFGFETGVFIRSGGGSDDVVDMYRKDSDARVSLAVVYTPFTNESLEPKLGDCFMEGLVPYPASLFHTIETLHEVHNPILFARYFESRRLFHEDSFRFW